MAFSQTALKIVAENKLRAAIEAGEFDNIPGLGKPSPVIDEPYHELWWIGRKLRREELVPKQKSHTKQNSIDGELRLADNSTPAPPDSDLSTARNSPPSTENKSARLW